MCEAGLLKLFGSACHSEPAETLAKFDRFASYLFSAVVDSDTESSVLSVAVETVGFIGSTADGKRALEQQGLLSLMHFYVLTLQYSVTVCILKCSSCAVKNVFWRHYDADDNDQLLHLPLYVSQKPTFDQ